MPQQFLKKAEVRQITKLSDSSIYRLAAQGKFPKPIKISERSSVWLYDEICQWQEDCITAARSGVDEAIHRYRHTE